MNLFYQPLISEGTLLLDPEESRHCVKVLRRSTGDQINLTDGKGFFYEAQITKADPRQCEFKIISKVPEPPRDFSIHIAISPTKNTDRLEWFVEKAVEFGVDKITPLLCKHTERVFIKKDRLEKVAVSAMKQSLKARVPVLAPAENFITHVQNAGEAERYIAYVDQSNPHHLKEMAKPGRTYLLLIGPEGDFAPEELELALRHNFTKVSLGKSRLRTETAGLAGCHILNLINT